MKRHITLVNYFPLLINKFKNNLFYKNIAIIASGSVAAKIIGLITGPIISRLYSPNDYGVLSLFGAITSIVGSLSTLRYEVTIPLPEKEEASDNLLKLCLLITFSLTLIWGVVVFLFGSKLAVKLSAEHAIPYLWVLPVTFLGGGVYVSLRGWAVRRKYFKTITRTKLSQSFFSRGTKIGLGFIGIGPLGLLIGLIVSKVAGVGTILKKLLKDNPEFFKCLSFKELWESAKRYKKFPLFQTWSQFLLGLGFKSPVLFITTFYGIEVVGLYGLAHNMINMPMNLIGSSISQVYFAEIASYGKDNPKKIYKLSLSIVKKMFFMGLIPFTILIIAGPWLFGFVFGQQWYEAGVYARFLSFIILTRFISSPVASCFNIFEMQGTQLFLSIVRVCLIVSIFTISSLMDLPAINAIAFYSITLTLYYLFLMFVIFRSIKGRIKY